ILLLPKTARHKLDKLGSELSSVTDITNRHLVYDSVDTVTEVLKRLNTPYSLDQTLYTPYSFLIANDAYLRGREEDKGTEERLYGYDATSVAVLHNKMVDDVKVLLAEYRLALKKNGKGSSRDSYLKMPNKN